MYSLRRDAAHGTCVLACAAVNAGAGNSIAAQVIIHGDSTGRTCLAAGSASDAAVTDYMHDVSSLFFPVWGS